MLITLKSTNLQDIDNFIKENLNNLREVKSGNQYIYKVYYFNENKIIFYHNLTFTIEGTHLGLDLEREIVKFFMDDNLYIGSDEVGVGESIGPIVVCGVTFKNKLQKEHFFKLGMIDSKKINYNKILMLGKEIKESVPHKCVILSVEKFNRYYLEENINIKLLNSIFHNRIHEELGKNFKNRISVIDEFVSKKKYLEYIDSSVNDVFFENEYIFETKAENKYIEVAAASILAKYIFNKHIVDVLEKNKISINKYIKNSINYNQIAGDINKNIIKIDDVLIKTWKK